MRTLSWKRYDKHGKAEAQSKKHEIFSAGALDPILQNALSEANLLNTMTPQSDSDSLNVQPCRCCVRVSLAMDDCGGWACPLLPNIEPSKPEVQEARHDDTVQEAFGALGDSQSERVLRPLRDHLPPVS